MFPSPVFAVQFNQVLWGSPLEPLFYFFGTLSTPPAAPMEEWSTANGVYPRHLMIISVNVVVVLSGLANLLLLVFFAEVDRSTLSHDAVTTPRVSSFLPLHETTLHVHGTA